MADSPSSVPGITRVGVWVRLSFYLALAGINTLMPALSELTAEKMEKMLWPQWAVLWLSPVAAMVLAGRLFLDQSLARLNGSSYKDPVKPPAIVESAVDTPPRALIVQETNDTHE